MYVKSTQYMCRIFFCVNPGGDNSSLLRMFLYNANIAGEDTRDAVDGIGFAMKLSKQNFKRWTSLRTLAHNPIEYHNDINDTINFVTESKPAAILAHIRVYVYSSSDRMPRTFPYFNNVNVLQPICFEQFTMALKGHIKGFPNPAIRGRIRAKIAPKYIARLTGLADTELVFYLILTHLCGEISNYTAQKRFGPLRLSAAIRSTINDILEVRSNISATIMFSTRHYVAVMTHGAGTQLFVYTNKGFAASNHAVSPEFKRVASDTIVVANLQNGVVVHTDVLEIVNSRF